MNLPLEQEYGEMLERVGYGELSPEQKRFIVTSFFQHAWYCFTLGVAPEFWVFATLEILELSQADEEIKKNGRARNWIFNLTKKLAARQVRKLGDRPGVNDAIMVNWFWTHNPKAAQQLWERSKREDYIGISCRWMLKSVQPRHPELTYLFSLFESGVFFLDADDVREIEKLNRQGGTWSHPKNPIQ